MGRVQDRKERTKETAQEDQGYGTRQEDYVLLGQAISMLQEAFSLLPHLSI